MKIINSNTLLSLLIIISSFTIVNVTEAQVTNDGNYNYDAYITALTINVDGEPVSTDEWVARLLAFGDGNNTPVDLSHVVDPCGRIYKGNGGDRVEGPDHNEDGTVDGAGSDFKFELNKAENNAGRKALDITVRTFEDDTSLSRRAALADCADEDDISRDDSDFGLIIIDESTVNNRLNGQFDLAGTQDFSMDNVDVTVAYTWRYAAGDATFNSLRFDTLEDNVIKKHINSNRIKPILLENALVEGIHNTELNYNQDNNGGGGDAGSVYYSFILDARSEVTISTDNNVTDFDTHLTLFDVGAQVIAEHDDIDGASNRNSLITEELDAGTYVIRVDGFDGGGLFELSVLNEEIPSINDNCTDANPLDYNSTIVGSNSDVDNMPLSDCQFNGTSQIYSQWYSFTGDGSNVTFELTTEVPFNTSLMTAHLRAFIYSGDCGSLMCESFIPEVDMNGEVEKEFQTEAGKEYKIMVGVGVASLRGDFTLSMTRSTNDICDKAIGISCGETVNDSTTFSRVFDALSCFGTNDPPLPRRSDYYSFTGDGTLIDINVVSESALLFLYSGACTSLTCEGAFFGINPKIEDFQSVSGAQYFILIADQANQEGVMEYALTLSCSTEFEPCADGYTGNNALTGDQTTPGVYSTNQSIASDQIIGDPILQLTVNYSAGAVGQSVILLPNFEVKSNTNFEVDFLGCN